MGVIYKLYDKWKHKWLSRNLGAFGNNSNIPLKKMLGTNWKNIFIGDSVSVGPECSLCATEKTKIIIKDGAIIAPKVTILTRSHEYDAVDLDAIPYSETYIAGDVIIGEAAWIGQGVIILAGVSIGKGAVIGAGSVVAKSVPDYAVCVGNPLKIIKYRDKERFETLLSDRKFSKDNKMKKVYKIVEK